MRHLYRSDKLKFYIGDVRDPRACGTPWRAWITSFMRRP